VSLNAPLTDWETGAEERGNFLVDESPLPDETVGGRIDSGRRGAWLRDAMAKLSDREALIMRARKLSEESATLESLAGRLGVSKERVRQIEARALEKLRRNLIDCHPDEFAGARP
jgi:RNA polymerase sigma-32 factor